MCTYLDQVRSTYYFRRAVPDELQRYLLTERGNPRSEFKISLRTKVREDAKRLLPDYVRMTDRLFDEARAQLMATVPSSDASVSAPLDGEWLGEFATEEAEFIARRTAEREARRLARRELRLQLREKLAGTTAEIDPRDAVIADLVREQRERADAAEARLKAVEAVRGASDVPGPPPLAKRSTVALWLDGEIVDGWAAERKPSQKGIDTHRSTAR
ncbi:hypothetical protein GCM10022281_15240 [Sphingomonas rosea]|uniref:DUF6538 domain-containing protein n=1 Tax=Sphingomonas rosea TaxID=335605 RepID=A0ABP7U418_9SPHN